jgi:hypothetical protein
MPVTWFLFTRVQEPRLADPFPEAPSSREFRHKRPQRVGPRWGRFFDARGGELGHPSPICSCINPTEATLLPFFFLR